MQQKPTSPCHQHQHFIQSNVSDWTNRKWDISTRLKPNPYNQGLFFCVSVEDVGPISKRSNQEVSGKDIKPTSQPSSGLRMKTSSGFIAAINKCTFTILLALALVLHTLRCRPPRGTADHHRLFVAPHCGLK